MSGSTAYQEQVFFFYILKNQIYLIPTKPEFFQNKNLRLAFEIAKEHALRYKECPSKDQMIELVNIKGIEELSLDMIESIYNTEALLQNYDKEWLEEHVGAWIQIRNLDHTFRKGIAYLKTTQVTVDNASEVVENIRHMMVTETAINFEFKTGSDFFDPASHLQTRLARTPTGYPYIDKCLKGGFWKGSLVAFLGGAKCGKSLWMQNLAAQSVLNGFNTAYITLELQEELVHMRIGSNLLNINIDEYEEKAKDQDFMRKKLNKIKQESLKPVGHLSVKEFPSSTASVNDIRAHLKKEEEILGIKFENIFIDYINIMKNWRNQNSENTYMKIKQISEDLRAMAMEELWAVITVTQTNRCISPESIVYHKEKGKIQIKDIIIGDYILGDEGYKKVINKFINKKIKTYKIKTKSGKEIIASDNHIFPINGGYKKLSNLKIGEKIYSKLKFKDIIEDEIISIKEYNEIDTIDIEIDSKNKLFFANDILTHNSGWETSDLNLGNIAESAALVHTVDGLFGIITSPEMKAKKIYYLKYLADRVSGLENTRKLFDVDFKFGRISENTESPIEDLDYAMKSTINYQSKDLSISRTIGNQIPELQEPKINNDIKQSISNLKWE